MLSSNLQCKLTDFSLQARIHKRREKEERVASARAGREDRPQFGARTATKQKKVGFSTMQLEFLCPFNHCDCKFSLEQMQLGFFCFSKVIFFESVDREHESTVEEITFFGLWWNECICTLL